MAIQEMEASRIKYTPTHSTEPKNVKTWQSFIDQLNHRLIEINNAPNLSKSTLVIISKPEELGKLLKQLEIMRETWLALKFNDEIFVVWKELVFLYLKENRENKLSTG